MPVCQRIENTLKVGGLEFPGGVIFQLAPVVALIFITVKALLANAFSFFDSNEICLQIAQCGLGLFWIEALPDGGTIGSRSGLGFPLSGAVERLEFFAAVFVFAEIDPVTVTTIGVFLIACHKNFSSFQSAAS